MKKNYILVECIEREINLPEFFETKEQAYNDMAQRMSEILGMRIDEIESYDDYDIGISKVDSYTHGYISDYHGLNYDWKIFKINDDKTICDYV